MNNTKKMHFKVHVPLLLEEIEMKAMNNNNAATLRIPMRIFRGQLLKLATRCSQVNDPILNQIMAEMALYAISDPTDPEFNQETTDKIIEEGEKCAGLLSE